jgi:hypothetical protein
VDEPGRGRTLGCFGNATIASRRKATALNPPPPAARLA